MLVFLLEEFSKLSGQSRAYKTANRSFLLFLSSCEIILSAVRKHLGASLICSLQ